MGHDGTDVESRSAQTASPSGRKVSGFSGVTAGLPTRGNTMRLVVIQPGVQQGWRWAVMVNETGSVSGKMAVAVMGGGWLVRIRIRPV
jgi:hypothetical protein